MNDVIFETVVSSVALDGKPHLAPMGVRYARQQVVLMPFKPSTTLDNITATGHAVLNILTDTRVFAGCVTGRRDWPVLPADKVAGVRLACALRTSSCAWPSAATTRSARSCTWRRCTK